MSSTQQLILLTLFILRPVSSVQTDFIRDSNKMSKGNWFYTLSYSTKARSSMGLNSKTPTRNKRRI